MSHRDDVVYCTLHRNGSGHDAGQIDYSINHSRIEKLPADERLELVRVALELAKELGQFIDWPETVDERCVPSR